MGRARQDRGGHRALAALGIYPRDDHVSDRILAVRALHTIRRGSVFSETPAPVSVALFPWSRRQRCAEDHGYHHSLTVLAGLSRRRVPCTVLGYVCVLRHHRI